MKETNSPFKYYNFLKASRYAWAVSAVVLLICITSLILPGRGLNYGIDFTGGAILDVHFDNPVTVSSIRAALAPIGWGDSVIQLAGQDQRSALIRTKPITDAQRREINSALESKVGKFEVRRVETVAPVVGRELVRNAIIAVILAAIGMLVYIALRFEFRFAIAGIVALVHDTLIVIGFFSLMRLEVDSSFVAAVLTVVGYSINDTIVVYDRIRENLKTRSKETYYHLVNRSISETLVRSINTSVTIFLAIVSLYVLGGSTIKNFTLALLIGVIAGTYSTTFVASSLWLYLKEREDKKASLRKEEASKSARDARAVRQARAAGQLNDDAAAKQQAAVAFSPEDGGGPVKAKKNAGAPKGGKSAKGGNKGGKGGKKRK